MAASLAALVAGCSATPKIEEVKDVGNGSYTIAYSMPTAVLDAKRQDKAGDFCHAKNMKIMVTGTGNNVVMFRCVGN
jgi:hypothetical protein